MHSKPLALRFFLAVLVLVVLAGCSSPTPPPTPAPTNVPQPTVNLQPTLVAAQTQAVQTFVANLTQNAPTATRVPPTNTAAPTQAPTNPPAKAAATATQVPPVVGRTATAPIFCNVNSVLINDGTAPISAGESFKATFVVLNTGSVTWTKSSFSLSYWSGVRFAGQQRMDLPFDVGQGSDMTIATGQMTAPSNSGTFRAVWAIYTGFTPYCLIPLTVVVK